MGGVLEKGNVPRCQRENVLCAFRLACLRSLLKKSSSGFLLYVYLTDKNIFVTDVCFATYIFVNKEQLCLLGSDK